MPENSAERNPNTNGGEPKELPRIVYWTGLAVGLAGTAALIGTSVETIIEQFNQ